ncbi:AAA family ATPase [Flavobacterium sp. MK4S-17]|uniref:AAA family ATPase n=1 Tax=Flavobacterium sp. MK4S-17 TaxID=2543737 RepID=UPI001357FAC0|nr:AAA family ATPase [Flavobacterium sp. MK4S-17]
MRIDSLYIEDFKNLKQFKIDLDENELNTVLLGQNATGKSNFIESLVLIFKYLDLSKAGSTPRFPEFEYEIKYKCRKHNIKITCKIDEKTKKSSYEIYVDEKKQSYKSFFINKEIYLPKYVFTYYSGISNKLKDHFDENQRNFYNKAKVKGVTKEDVEDFRRMFYVQLVHSYFVLLAFYTFEEEKTKKFLLDYLNIENLESVLFKFQKPEWQKNAKFQDEFMWGAEGLVREFLDKLWEISFAPIDVYEEHKESFRDSSNKQKEFLYLFVPTKEKLQELNKFYHTNTDLFKALESTYISDLIDEVRVKVKKTNVNNEITFKELSEGEQQLLTVLGLLKFTKDKETLVLLDEPDTHLNPLWKWHYLDLLNDIYRNDSETESMDLTTHIIINTHAPLVIGGLKKGQIRIFRRNPENGNVIAEPAEKDPKGMGVAGILTSELFGLPTILDKETQLLLNRKRYLQGKLMRNDITNEEYEEYKVKKSQLEEYGFYEEVEDKWFQMYLAEMSKYEIIQQIEFTDKQKVMLEEASKLAVEKILKEMNQNDNEVH